MCLISREAVQCNNVMSCCATGYLNLLLSFLFPTLRQILPVLELVRRRRSLEPQVSMNWGPLCPRGLCAVLQDCPAPRTERAPIVHLWGMISFHAMWEHGSTRLTSLFHKIGSIVCNRRASNDLFVYRLGLFVFD